MAIQYVSDDAGNPTAVLVPITEWNSIAAKHEDVRVLMQESAQPRSKRKPSEFRGILDKEVAKQMMIDIEKDRNEWEKRF
ncbi:hypothetical protein [Mucilaginibacter pedocola]|uniref:Prevent-host-death protein n=1 Tax=Mucilaginibacter pedocola TaxID=1792845 RepID=A0A1S9PFB3_9SPHI|nr:hypothetical protein [Mucilaginibacter pedocola]OOQ59288.1 hypothetical protein BC343_28635 [Mucilaginibacter pedocola]